MATTTNYSWTTPDDTDLVKDGAAAIRTLGSAIDTTVFNNAGAAVAKSLIDAEGDLIVGDAADAVQRLAIGSDGNVLTVDTTVDGKIKWAAPAGGGANWTLLNAGGTALTGASIVTVSGISGKDQIMVQIRAAGSTFNNDQFGIRINTDSGTNYFHSGATANSTGPSAANTDVDYIILADLSTHSGSRQSSITFISGGNASGVKPFFNLAGATPSGGSTTQVNRFLGGIWNNSATITSISVLAVSGTLNNGTVFIYTSA